MLNLIQHLRYNNELARPNQHDQTTTDILNQVQDDRREYFTFKSASPL